ncbi:MAG: alkaline phosphatase family protein [Chloroflexi bacterium]|nr:alkaline phosphatase family protein [Chloroflexota bacterium]
MASKPKRIAIIGLDCPVVPLLEKHLADGYLPNIKRLVEGGAFAENCLVPYPTITPPNWITIATGALIGTHGITDFWRQHRPGQSPINANTIQNFDSADVQAETIWEAADKAGKKCIVFNYPVSWPSRMTSGVVVGGAGLTPGEVRTGLPGLQAKFNFCANQVITTGIYPGAIRSEFASAEGWLNLTEPGEEPLELAAKLNFPEAAGEPEPTTWYVLARQSGGDTYDSITLSPNKNLRDAFFTLHVGEWSPKVWTTMNLADGSAREVFFRAKLVELSADAEDFRLFLTALVDMAPLMTHPDLLAKIDSPEGIPVPSMGLVEYSYGTIDLETYVECADLYGTFCAEWATSLLQAVPDWDLFCMHSHPPDFLYHMLMNDIDPATDPDDARRERFWDAHRRIYESQDRMVGRIVEAAGRDTLIVLVSDHGATADGPSFDPFDALVPAGLAAVGRESEGHEVGEGWYGDILKTLGLTGQADASRSKAIPQRVCYVYVNLKGRDPEGIVERADYEQVQQQIVDALLTYVHPKTGTRPAALALTKQDARLLGLYGDRVGDVVYAVYPWFGSQHGNILPTGEWSLGSLRGLLVFNGPGVKKGTRIARTVGLQDVVPTVCHLADLPVPETVDGAIIWQALKDTQAKDKEIAKLQGGLERMQAALARKTRQPWDKHDCA